MEEDLTEFQELVLDRFGEMVYPDGEHPISHEADMEYELLYCAPVQYEVEPEMLEYAKNHPSATMKELVEYFRKIAPLGLAPGDDGADLLDDE